MRSTQWNFSYFVVRTRLLCHPRPPVRHPRSLCRVKFDIELFFSVITLIAGDAAAPLITGAIAVMSLGRLFSRERARCFYFRRLTELRSVAVSSSGPVTIVSRLSFSPRPSLPSLPPVYNTFVSLYFIYDGSVNLCGTYGERRERNRDHRVRPKCSVAIFPRLTCDSFNLFTIFSQFHPLSLSLFLCD